MPDVVIKNVLSQPMLAYRDSQMTGERLYHLFDVLSQHVSKRAAEKSRYGSLLTVLYSDILTPEAAMDLEIGVLLTNDQVKPLMIVDDVTLTVRELPAVEQMATSVHRGLDDHPITYNALGRWLEQHHYRIVGPGREVLLEQYDPAEPEMCIMEIQFPVERINVAEFDFLESIQL